MFENLGCSSPPLPHHHQGFEWRGDCEVGIALPAVEVAFDFPLFVSERLCLRIWLNTTEFLFVQLRGVRHSLLGLSWVCSPPRWSLLCCPARIAEGTKKDGQKAALSCMEVCSDASIPLFCSFILWGIPSGASEVRDWAVRRSASWRLTHHCGRSVYGHPVKGWAAGPGLTHPLGFQGSSKWWQKSYWRLSTFQSMYIKRRRAIPVFRIKKNNCMTSCSLMQGKTFFYYFL